MEYIKQKLTAKLAKEKGFDDPCFAAFATRGFRKADLKELDNLYNVNYPLKNSEIDNASNKQWVFYGAYTAPTLEELKKFIRDVRGVHIEILRNASGYYWNMCKSDGGTDLGWSENLGPNDGAVWDEYEDALEYALQLQLSYDLPDTLCNIGHWSNYVEFASESLKKIYESTNTESTAK